MYAAWLVLVPPMLVIAFAMLTRRILFSLFIGITSAALVVHDFNVGPAAHYLGKRLLMTSQLDKLTSWDGFLSCTNLFVILFLILIGVLIAMIRHSGAAYAYGALVRQKIKTSRGAELAVLCLANIFFIDDYFSGITVGSVMQPITDQFKVPRVKLALLVNSVAGPLAIIVPLSSWVAELIGQLRNSGVGIVGVGSVIVAEPFGFYASSIPFMMYALILVLSIWYIVLTRIGYGTVGAHEAYARKTSELFGGKLPVARRVTDIDPERTKHALLTDFLLPIVLLFLSVLGITLWTGDWALFGGANDIMTTIQNAKMSLAFFTGGLFTVVVTAWYYLLRGRVYARELFSFVREGYFLMGSSLFMLLFIWTLSGMIREDLKTGMYLANLLVGSVQASFFPLMFFALAALISTLIGTAWGTLGILIPLAFDLVPSYLGLGLPIALEQLPMLSALLGAIISGSIVGMHMSPVADVILMSAMSVGAYHLDVVRAQIQLAIPTVLSSLLAFYVVGTVWATHTPLTSAGIGLIVGFACNVILLHGLSMISHRRKR